MARVTAAALAAAAIAVLAGCGKAAPPQDAAAAQHGQRLLAQYQCGSCHHIPGVQGAAGDMAVPLAAFGRRSYIAGRLPNDAVRLAHWIADPAALVPGTAMPSMGASAEDAGAMAAYLLTLR